MNGKETCKRESIRKAISLVRYVLIEVLLEKAHENGKNGRLMELQAERCTSDSSHISFLSELLSEITLPAQSKPETTAHPPETANVHYSQLFLARDIRTLNFEHFPESLQLSGCHERKF